jgi:DNA-binding NtrC family response regulator
MPEAQGRPARTVLVVEDDDEALASFNRAFHGAGWVVISARSGTDAIALVRGGLKPQSAVIDIGLPGASGFDVLREFVSASPGTRTVACSSLDDPVLVSTSLKAGAYAFVPKSAGIAEVLKAAEG